VSDGLLWRIVASHRTPRARDAAKSRAAILRSGASLFAELGYDGATLQQIGEQAALSRAAPAYFFESKRKLYDAVLDELFAARDQAMREAFAPLHSWARNETDETLEGALAKAVTGYLDFLLGHPDFVRVVQWEALSGGARLRAAPTRSRVAEDAFQTLRRVSKRRGLATFDAREAVVVFTSLCFFPIAFQTTFLGGLGLAIATQPERRRHTHLVVRALTQLIRPSP
jgi:TetR/AcrR family transcriptional regulator